MKLIKNNGNVSNHQVQFSNIFNLLDIMTTSNTLSCSRKKDSVLWIKIIDEVSLTAGKTTLTGYKSKEITAITSSFLHT